MDAGRQR